MELKLKFEFFIFLFFFSFFFLHHAADEADYILEINLRWVPLCKIWNSYRKVNFFYAYDIIVVVVELVFYDPSTLFISSVVSSQLT